MRLCTGPSFTPRSCSAAAASAACVGLRAFCPRLADVLCPPPLLEGASPTGTICGPALSLAARGWRPRGMRAEHAAPSPIGVASPIPPAPSSGYCWTPATGPPPELAGHVPITVIRPEKEVLVMLEAVGVHTGAQPVPSAVWPLPRATSGDSVSASAAAWWSRRSRHLDLSRTAARHSPLLVTGCRLFPS